MMIPILFCAGKTIITDGNFWRNEGAKKDVTRVIQPARGNILDCNGRLLAGYVPSYELFMDFKADGFKKDTLDKYMESIAACLSQAYKNIRIRCCIRGC